MDGLAAGETHEKDGSDEDLLTGPHGWLNWLAERAGHPRRTDSSTAGALLIPLWEEYGLYSDCWLVGDLSLGPATFELTFPAERAVVGGAQMMLLVRVHSHLGNPSHQLPSAETEDVAAYHGGDIGDEFSALLSLALGRRVRSGGVIRHAFSDKHPYGRPFYANHRVPRLGAPTRGASILPGITDEASLETAQPLMDVYARLSGTNAVTVVRAASEYADALWWADLDPRIAWIKLVSALEIAAAHWVQAQGLTRLERFKTYMGLTYKKLKTEHGEAVAESVGELWDENAGSTARLVAFTVKHAPKPPPIRPMEVEQLNWDGLESALRLIYTYRSRDLHGGLPFPGPMLDPPRPAIGNIPPERFTAIAAGQGGGTWPAKSMPMFLHVFAFIARQALCTWWSALPDAQLLMPDTDGSA